MVRSLSHHDKVISRLPRDSFFLRNFGNFTARSYWLSDTVHCVDFLVCVFVYKGCFIRYYKVSQRRYRSSANALAPVVTYMRDKL